MRKSFIYLIAFMLFTVSMKAQLITPEEYVNTYKDIAMREMIRSGVPASITLAQGILETESGNSKLVKKSNNHFGIKCKETWTGPSVSHDDDAPGECFRKYPDANASYVDHSDFLRTRKHYAFLFDLDPLDYKSWAYGLKKAGYATNPRYPEILIKYIEKYNLHEYSLIAMGNKQPEAPVAQVPVAVEPPKDPVTVVVPETKSQPSTPPVQASVPQLTYPEGVFKINETRVVYAVKGTPFLAIAQQYAVPLKYIFDFNELPEREAIENDQLIYLQRKRRTASVPVHIVKEGEGLYTIAQQYGIRFEALLQLNKLNAGQLPAPGETLYLQTEAPTVPKLVQTKLISATPIQPEPTITTAASVPDLPNQVVHIVQHKETLYSIARKYDVSLAEIQQWNKLQGYDLKEGMQLVIQKNKAVGTSSR